MVMKNIKNKFQKLYKFRKKGSILIVTLFYVLMALAFLGFSYDVARIMYLKSYTRNLASVIALSIVNECGHVYQDSVNGARVVIVHDVESRPLKDYKSPYYADKRYVKEIFNRNKSGMDKTYHVDPDKDILLNPYYTSSGNVIPGSINKRRFEVGSDGINGEVEVHITAKVDLFFLPGRQATIHESAIAQPSATLTRHYETIREEQKIIFEYIDW